ncbi:unnamed protein product, partial [marine sediment metagenome]
DEEIGKGGEFEEELLLFFEIRFASTNLAFRFYYLPRLKMLTAALAFDKEGRERERKVW